MLGRSKTLCYDVVVKKKQTTVELISEFAAELGYKVEKIDTNNTGDVICVRKSEKICLIDGQQFGYYPTNLRWQSALLKDKITLQKFLNQHNLRTIPSKFFRKHDYKNYTSLRKELQKINLKFPLLLKPANGFGGASISILETKRDLNVISKLHYESGKDFIIQPILQHPEYRIFIAHGKIMAIHSKNHKYILSDGKRSIAEQLTRIPEHMKSKVFIKTFLKSKKWTLQSIPAEKEKIYYHLVKDNTKEFLITENFPPHMKRWAQKLHVILNAGIVGVDVFTPNGIDDPASFIIIELNANPSLRDYAQTYKRRDLSKKIFALELQKYFRNR